MKTITQRPPCYFPEEIIISILECLPAKSLIRFLSLSKAICSHIHSSSFITSHLKHFSRNPQSKFVFHICNNPDTGSNLLTLYPDDESYPNTRSLDFHFIGYGTQAFSHVIGCCNGVLCVLEINRNSFVFWNPRIRKSFKQLLQPSVPNFSWASLLGFGCDPSKNDYKLVSVYGGWDVERAAKLYTLNNNTWRIHSIPPPAKLFRIANSDSFSSVYVNGASHWLVKYEGRHYILSFHMEVEDFEELFLPDPLDQMCRKVPMRLQLFNGSLCLVSTRFDYYYNQPLCLWVMKEYGMAESWVNIFNISFGAAGIRECYRYTNYLKVLGLESMKGEVWVVKDGCQLAVYNHSTKELKIRGSYMCPPSYRESYVESLALLNVKLDALSTKPTRKRARNHLS